MQLRFAGLVVLAVLTLGSAVLGDPQQQEPLKEPPEVTLNDINVLVQGKGAPTVAIHAAGSASISSSGNASSAAGPPAPTVGASVSDGGAGGGAAPKVAVTLNQLLGRIGGRRRLARRLLQSPTAQQQDPQKPPQQQPSQQQQQQHSDDQAASAALASTMASPLRQRAPATSLSQIASMSAPILAAPDDGGGAGGGASGGSSSVASATAAAGGGAEVGGEGRSSRGRGLRWAVVDEVISGRGRRADAAASAPWRLPPALQLPTMPAAPLARAHGRSISGAAGAGDTGIGAGRRALRQFGYTGASRAASGGGGGGGGGRVDLSGAPPEVQREVQSLVPGQGGGGRGIGGGGGGSGAGVTLSDVRGMGV